MPDLFLNKELKSRLVFAAMTTAYDGNAVRYRSKAMLRVFSCVETMGDVSLCAVFSCEGCMAARREGASRGDKTSGSV